jgi:hypothetical protein
VQKGDNSSNHQEYFQIPHSSSTLDCLEETVEEDSADE